MFKDVNANKKIINLDYCMFTVLIKSGPTFLLNGDFDCVHALTVKLPTLSIYESDFYKVKKLNRMKNFAPNFLYLRFFLLI